MKSLQGSTPTASRQSLAPGAGQATRAESLRQRVRSRFPILSDGAIVAVDGRIGGDWVARGLVDQALRAFAPKRPASRSGFSAPHPDEVRALLEQIDGSAPPAPQHFAKVVLLEVGPRRLHAYWHAPRTVLERAALSLGESGQDWTLVLRMHDVTGIRFDGIRSNHSFDIEITADETRRSIDLWSPDATFVAQIGLRAADGRFRPVACSDTALATRDAPGSEEAHRINIPANVHSRVRPSMPERFRLDAPRIIVASELNDWPLRDLEAERRIRALYLAFLRDGPRVLRLSASTPRPDESSLRGAYALRRRERERTEATALLKASEVESSDVLAFRVDSATETAPPSRREARLPALSRLRRPSLQDLGREERAAEVKRFTALFAKGPTAPVSLMPLRLPAPCPTEAQAPKLPTLPSRRDAHPVRVNRVDRLIENLEHAGVELEAELVLRGRVKPGKKVRIGGRVIETQPDGSFVVRCVVRDGKLHVPVEVVEAEVVTCRQEVNVDLGTPKAFRSG